MKQPYEINSDFFKKMISSGWYPERDIVLEKLPSHIEDLPSVVKKFLREIWYISVTKDFYMKCLCLTMRFILLGKQPKN